MTTIGTDPVARTEILARIRRASTDITNSDPVADVPIEWEYGTGIDMDDVVGTFVEKVIDYKATVVRVKGADVPQAVVEGLRSTGAEHSAVFRSVWTSPGWGRSRLPGLTPASMIRSYRRRSSMTPMLSSPALRVVSLTRAASC